MRRFVGFAILLLCWPAYRMRGEQQAEAGKPLRLKHFMVSGVPRLNALARLGAASKSTLLIECGDMRFLTEPVTLSAWHKTEDELIIAILRGPERYTANHRGALTIVSPQRPLVPTNRILSLPLGSFSFRGRSIPSLSSLLDFYIRMATGCHPASYAYAGPPMELKIRPFVLKSATFQGVIERAAGASLPTMWVVLPDAGKGGCIADPGSMWQVGFYADSQLESPFRESTGPQIVP